MKPILALVLCCLFVAPAHAFRAKDAVATRNYPQFPSTEDCRSKVSQLYAQLTRMQRDTDWEHPLHWALTDGMYRDIHAWEMAAELNDPVKFEQHGELQQQLIVLIGYDAFLHGWLPPVPDWRPPAE